MLSKKNVRDLIMAMDTDKDKRRVMRDSNAPPPEGRLLTQQEREEAMRAAGQLQRETDQPVSVFEAVCVAQDKKTAGFIQTQVDAAEADAERSMAAYKDLYSTMLRFDTMS
jgi:hypothetical protein